MIAANHGVRATDPVCCALTPLFSVAAANAGAVIAAVAFAAGLVTCAPVCARDFARSARLTPTTSAMANPTRIITPTPMHYVTCKKLRGDNNS
jgi:hypothetical protein